MVLLMPQRKRPTRKHQSTRTARILLLSTTQIFVFLVDALLLSDLPTPSFLVDVRALRKTFPDEIQPSKIPSIHLPKHRITFFPVQNFSSDKTSDTSPLQLDYDAKRIDVNFDVIEGEAALGYLHTSVIRAREDAISGQDDPVETFLAEVNFAPSLCIPNESNSNDIDDCSGLAIAKLVLGLNNHHVGSYYWARSAGSGSSMEAPGIKYGENISNQIGDANDDKCFHRMGTLRWEEDGGPTACNSNDGKRSEWVNFLRAGDTVQLVPMSGQDVLKAISERSDTNNYDAIRVFGVSLDGRPMGSEPEVLCEWRCE